MPLTEIEMLIEGGKMKESIPQILDLPEKLAEDYNINFVIVIDEFQYLRLASQSFPGLFHVMRSKWQFHKRVSYVISGSSVGLLEKTFSE
ncbi:hypothetical protein SJAV_01560 [Sulfurisphaera javensis]|uniref:ATPase n=1 Tax=Sulfurisphaera javensis TaxID=2049879 RepID=A0AAT9GMW3_9CREN